jgi:hypothetical protein
MNPAKPRMIMSVTAEASALGLRNECFKHDVQLAAVVTYYGNILFCTSIMSSIAGRIQSGDFEPIACLTMLMYDETQLTVALRDIKKNLQKLTHVQIQIRNGYHSADAKVMNNELHFAFIVHDKSANRTCCFHFEIPTPLTTCDRSTAENTKRVFDDLLARIPLLADFRSLFSIRINLNVRDRASSNLRAEAAQFRAYVGDLNLGLFCVAHNANTSAKGSISIINDVVSGAIAHALIQKPNGTYDIMWAVIVDVLITCSLPIIGGVPPRQDSEIIRYRDSVLAAFQGKAPKASIQKRVFVLKQKVHSDLQDKLSINVYLPGGTPLDNVADLIRVWAQDVATALAPRRLKIFAHHRWCTSGEVAAELFISEMFFGLLSRCIPLFIEALGKKLPLNSWQELEGSDIVIARLADEEHGKIPDEVAAWVAFNERQRGSAMRFSRSPFMKAGLCLWHACLAPCITLMSVTLDVCSDEFERMQQASAVLKGTRTFRIVEAAKGTVVEVFFKETMDRIFNESSWLFMPLSCQTEHANSLAFAMLARAVGSVMALIQGHFDSYPIKLFLIIAGGFDIDDVVAMIVSDPECMWATCDFTRMFRSKFPTRADLKSLRCRLVLEFMAAFLRFDTIRIECRNALIRRLLLKGTTWISDFIDASSDWMLLRQRTILGGVEGQGDQDGPGSERKDDIESGAAASIYNESKKIVGGGACRSFLSEWFLKHPWDPTRQSQSEWYEEAHESYRQLKADPSRIEELQKHVRQGKAAMLSKRVGGESFGGRRQTSARNNTTSLSRPLLHLHDERASSDDLHGEGVRASIDVAGGDLSSPRLVGDELALVPFDDGSPLASDLPILPFGSSEAALGEHLQLIRRMSREKCKRKSALLGDLADDIRQWQIVAMSGESHPGPTFFSESPEWWQWGVGPRPRPMGRGCELRIIDWKFPIRDFLDKCLVGLSGADRAEMITYWASLHQRYNQADAPALCSGASSAVEDTGTCRRSCLMSSPFIINSLN